MRVRALCGFCIGGGKDVWAGEEFEAPDHMVRYWVTIGNVVLVDPAAQIPAQTLRSDRLYTQDGAVVNMDPGKAK